METKLDRVNRWLTLAANIGVLLGVIFVGYELRLSTDLAKLTARQEIAHDSYVTALTIAGDEGLAEAVYLVNDGQPLTPVQDVRLRTLVYATNAIYDNIFFQYQEGMVSQDQWGAFENSLRRVRGEPSNVVYWMPELYSESYRELVERIDEEIAR